MKAVMKILSVANTVFDAVVQCMAYLAAAILVFITGSICLDVVLRYSINRPLKWVFEGTEYSLLFITFLAATWVLRKDGHVKLDLALNALGERSQAWVNTVTSLIVAGVCIVITCSSANYVIYLYQHGITITKYYTLPQFAIISIIPIGFFLLFIQSLKRAYAYIRKIKEYQT